MSGATATSVAATIDSGFSPQNPTDTSDRPTISATALRAWISTLTVLADMMELREFKKRRCYILFF